MKKIIIIIILIFISLVSICFAEETKQPKVIEAQAGQNFTIILKANATTGYQWQFAKLLDESIVHLISSEYLADKTKLVGAGGKQVWIFKALKAGQTNISFKYVRSWEKNTPPQNEESFVIVIKQQLK
jgi:inhibitor of cysteine peptidase